ncbi:MAG: hypothetical protein KGV56_01155 [Gammaproteobacteria bacterium]|nr:hypothetical protein [Gammaproteobacteria bacterium]
MKNYKYNTLIAFIVLSIIVGIIELYFKTGTVIFIAFLVMAGFHYLNSSSQNNMNLTLEQEFYNKHYAFNKFDYYVIDDTKCFGLFIKLFNQPVFIELREDNLLEKRKKQALYLSKNTRSLERNLNIFLEENPTYKEKKLEAILLCYDDVTLGDVFWEPTGNTSIKALTFTL